MDGRTKRLIYDKDKDIKVNPASITKIMTAIVAIEYGDIDAEVEVGEEIYEAYGSAIYS